MSALRFDTGSSATSVTVGTIVHVNFEARHAPHVMSTLRFDTGSFKKFFNIAVVYAGGILSHAFSRAHLSDLMDSLFSAGR